MKRNKDIKLSKSDTERIKGELDEEFDNAEDKEQFLLNLLDEAYGNGD